MIRCNLAVLLAERGLKISKVAVLTGISRTTLTSLAHNHSQGIQFDTLNSLCNFLKVEPNELLTYTPVDIVISSFEMVGYDEIRIDIGMTVREKGNSVVCLVCGEVKVGHNDGLLQGATVALRIDDSDNDGSILAAALARIPVTFRNDLTSKISDEIYSFVYEKFAVFDDEIVFKFNWPVEFH